MEQTNPNQFILDNLQDDCSNFHKKNVELKHNNRDVNFEQNFYSGNFNKPLYDNEFFFVHLH